MTVQIKDNSESISINRCSSISSSAGAVMVVRVYKKGTTMEFFLYFLFLRRQHKNKLNKLNKGTVLAAAANYATVAAATTAAVARYLI